MDRPSALLLVPVMPAEGGNGLAMRAGLLLEGLARSCSVDVLVVPVFGGPGRPGELVNRLASSFCVLDLQHEPDGRADLVRRLADPEQRERARALHPRPMAVRGATLAVAETVREAAVKAQLVVAMRIYLAPFLDALLERADRPRLALDVDDIESRTQPALGHREEGRRFERLEAHYLPLMDRVIACSQADANYLVARYGLPGVSVVPNAVRPPAQPPVAVRRQDLIFVGNLSYGPNVDGARWLCHEVLPRLGDASLALVGSNPAPEVLSLGDGRRVIVAADVPDVGPWYASATLATVPLRLGGGTRIKVLEALAHRRPVVSTTVGVRGLDLDPVLIGDTPAAFAAACRRLLDDPALADQLARRGEVIVREQASVDAVAGTIDGLVLDIVGA